MNDEIYRSFQRNYYPQRLEIKHNTHNISAIGMIHPSEVYINTTVDITMDGQKFSELATALYNMETEANIRNNNPTLQKAYEKYKILLELTKQ